MYSCRPPRPFSNSVADPAVIRSPIRSRRVRRYTMSEEPRRLDFGRVAEAYERVQVPAIFTGWATDLVSIADLRAGERILDVACGTGIVARLAAPRVAPAGHVVGVDVNAAMLTVARAQPQPAGAVIEWHQGDAAALPFPDAAFDVVLCQQGLQHMADRGAAVREMRRVLGA